MKDIKNIEITAWSIAIVLSIGSLALSLSKTFPEYKEEVSKTDDIKTKTSKNNYHKDIEFISTPMEEYREFDSNAKTNIYLYQVKDEMTNNWVTLDIIAKKEYQDPPILLKDGRIIFVGQFDGDLDYLGVYQLETKYNDDDKWTKTDNYILSEYTPGETSSERAIYLGEYVSDKILKLNY